MDPILQTVLAVGGVVASVIGSIAGSSAYLTRFKTTTELAVTRLERDVAEIRAAAKGAPTLSAFENLSARLDEVHGQLGIVVSTLASNNERDRAVDANVVRLEAADRDLRHDIVSEIRAVEARLMAMLGSAPPMARGPKRKA